MLISDTITYRPDGTVSSVLRVTRETYTKPSGAGAVEDVSTVVTLDAVKDQLGGAYAAIETHNKALEEQIATERTAAVAEKEDAVRQTAEAAAAEKAEAIRLLEEKHARELAAKEAQLSEARAVAEEPVKQ